MGVEVAGGRYGVVVVGKGGQEGGMLVVVVVGRGGQAEGMVLWLWVKVG